MGDEFEEFEETHFKDEIDIEDEENIDDNFDNEGEEETFSDDDENDEYRELIESEKIKKKMTIYKTDAKSKKMYYVEEYVTPMILEYQKTLVFDGDGETLIDRDKNLENKILAEIEKVALAIVNQYRYWRFADIDDLMQECMKEAFRNLPKFNSEYIVDEETKKKTTSFNYFSLIFKRHLLNYTLRRKKHRNTADVDIMLDVENRNEINYNVFFSDLETTLLRIINENFIREKRKKYIDLSAILLDYLVKSKVFCGKSDLLSWFRGYGYKSSDYRNFINDLKPYQSLIYDIV